MTTKKECLNSEIKKTRKEMLNGIEYDVFEAVLIKKPVMHGILYTNASIEAGVPTYNDRIVSIAHGEGFDVGTPEEIEKRGVGRVYNSQVITEVNEDKKRSVLKAELWLNRSQAEKIGYANVIDDLNDGKSHDVSVGVVVEGIEHDGVDSETKYDFIATKLTLNHLAIIVDGKGECSQDDGCGVFGSNDTASNQKSCDGDGDCKGDCCKKTNQSTRLEKNEGYFRLSNMIAKELQEKKDGWVYIEEIYDDFFVYEMKDGLFKVSYKFKDGNLDISNNEIQVFRKVEYVELFGGLPQGDNEMYDSLGDGSDILSLNQQESQDEPTKDELEDDVILDETEDDTMSEKDVKKTNGKGVTDAFDPEALKEMLNGAISESLKPFQDILLDLKNKSDQERDALEKQVLSLNSQLDADDVGAMPLTTLKKLASKNQASVDFSANGTKTNDKDVIYISNAGGII